MTVSTLGRSAALSVRRAHKRWTFFATITWGICGVVALVAAVGTVANLIGVQVTPYNPDANNYFAILHSPSLAHPFGTDELGRDVFSRVVYGTHLSIDIALGVVLIAGFIGTVVGVVAGYTGGWVDEILMRVVDMFFAFPVLILAAAISIALGAGLVSTTAALAIVYWPLYARLVRGQTLAMRTSEMVQAEIALGARRLRILAVHIIPNLLFIVVIQMSLDVGYAVLSIAGLSFLGLGAQPPTPEWGAMLLSALDYFSQAWWLAVFPGAALAITVIGFNCLGDLLRDKLDPHLANG